jgi:hypothetical protein
MTKNFKERLEAIEARLRTKPGAGMFSILEVTGCLPGPINFAYAGLHRWDRAEGEGFEAFVRRAADAAIESGQMALNVGGLPRSDEYAKYRKPDGEFDFERWWQEVAAPYYPEVPPEEPAGYRPPSPGLRPIERRDIDR